MRVFFFVLIAIYLLYKLGILRFNFQAEVGSKEPNNRNFNRRPPDGNVNVDSVPPKEEKQKKDFKGGEYVDYEDVK